MATAVTPAVAIGSIATLATVPYERKLRMTSLIMDNQSGALRTIYFRDDFNADPSVGNPAGSSQTIPKAQYSVAAGVCAVIKADELRDKEFIGALKCYADAGAPACVITADFEYF